MDNGFSVEAVREDFPALKNRRYGKPPVYLDNACTTLVPEPVIKAMTEYYTAYPACGGGRSRHWFAEEVTGRIEGDPEGGWQDPAGSSKNLFGPDPRRKSSLP